jgi:hypothetical protein
MTKTKAKKEERNRRRERKKKTQRSKIFEFIKKNIVKSFFNYHKWKKKLQ